MEKVIDKRLARERRKKRIRKKVWGTAERPRMAVFRSLRHIHVQLINDDEGKTILGISSLSPEIRKHLKNGGNVESAKVVGEFFAKKALELGITKVVFDRSGYAYHGRIKALAEKAREVGLQF